MQHNSLKHCYTDIDGNKWYEFISDRYISYRRYSTAQHGEVIIRNAVSMKLMEQFKSNLIDNALNADSKGMQVYAEQSSAYLYAVLNLLLTSGPHKDIANVFYLLEDEPLDDVTPFFTVKKKEIWDKDPGAAALIVKAYHKYNALQTFIHSRYKSLFADSTTDATLSADLFAILNKWNTDANAFHLSLMDSRLSDVEILEKKGINEYYAILQANAEKCKQEKKQLEELKKKNK